MGDDPKTEAGREPVDKLFTQTEVDDIVARRVARVERKYQRLLEGEGGLPAERYQALQTQEKLDGLQARAAGLERELRQAHGELEQAAGLVEKWKDRYARTLAQSDLGRRLEQAGVVPGARDLALSHLLNEAALELDDQGNLNLMTRDGRPLDDDFLKKFLEPRRDLLAPTAGGGAGSRGSDARPPAPALDYESARQAVRSGAFQAMTPAQQARVQEALAQGRPQP